MADTDKRRTFRQFYFRGKNLEELMEMSLSEFANLLTARLRRHIDRGINKYEDMVLKKVVEYKEEERRTGEKPEPIKTYERSMIIFPMMVDTTIAVHCGNGFFPLDVRPEMIGRRLRDYVHTRTICTHGKPGIGASSGSKFVPLK